jgi:hypothetical protein
MKWMLNYPGMQVVFTIAAAIAAVLVTIHDSRRGAYARLWGVPWISWLVLMAMLCPTVHIVDYTTDAVVKGLELAATRLQLDNVHYTLIGLSNALKCAPTWRSHSTYSLASWVRPLCFNPPWDMRPRCVALHCSCQAVCECSGQLE